MSGTPARRIAAGVALGLAALVYSTWVVEILAGWPLPVHRAFSSELAATGQPTATATRTMDAIAGGLALAAVGIGHPLVQTRPQRWITWGLLAFGVGTVADAIFPMSCAPSLAPGCDKHAAGPLGLGMLPHELSSGTAGVGIIVFTAAALRAAVRSGRVVTRAIVPLLAASLLVQFWLAVHSLAVVAQPRIDPGGWLQRAALAMTSLTLLALAGGFTEPHHSPPASRDDAT